MRWTCNMPLKHACFISYRHVNHSEYNVLSRVTSYLHSALSSELDLLTNRDVVIDWNRLQGGHLYNQTLEIDICKSACMIVVYSPAYFDKYHTYCAREY